MVFANFLTVHAFAIVGHGFQSGQTPFYFFIMVVYLLTVYFLRKHRLRSTLHQFPYHTRESFSSMTLHDAFLIQQRLCELEFPFTFHKGLQFALFRTYGIPSISKLLVKTKQLSEPATACKRYVDTEVLVSEFCQYPPESERAIEAIARTNYIHSFYRDSKQVSNEDMLYTLSLFALEPMRWVDRYEWRRLENFEKNALGTFWKAIGDAMGIEYANFLDHGKEGWKDGLQWFEDVSAWAEEYEVTAMKPSIDNHRTAEETTKLLLWYVPDWAKGLGKLLVVTLMDQRLRTAMLYDRPPWFLYQFTAIVFTLRKFCLRFLALPRPAWLASHNTSHKRNHAGRYHLQRLDAGPYYVKPTLWGRFGPFSWATRLLGKPLPGDENFCPNGFKVDELGQNFVKGKGSKYIQNSKEEIMRLRMRGCPFAS